MIINKLEQLRDEKDFKKKDIAKILDVSASVYSRWERGIDIIPTKRMYEIANYYEVNLDYLLGFTTKKVSMKSDEKIDISLISTRMIEIRKDFNETLRVFVKRLNTSSSTWSAYETGKVLILGAFLLEICKFGNYSADWILGRSNKKYRD